MKTHYLIYRGTACHEMDADHLDNMMQRSRDYNSQHHITGLFLHAGRQFIQVLEGELPAIHRLYAAIQEDPCHTNLLLLHEGTGPQRIFPHWSMGYCAVDCADFAWLTGYLDPRHCFDVLPPSYNAGQVVLGLLAEFVEGRTVRHQP